MEPTREQLAALARQLAATAPDEIDCDAVLEHVAAYVEAFRGAHELPIELTRIGQHLDVCPGCREEFEAILRAAELG